MNKLSWPQALSWIIGSCFVFSCIAHKTIRYGFDKRRKMLKEQISYIVQTGPQKAMIHSDYFCELLGLSCDEPMNYGNFDEQKAQDVLLRSPVLENVSVKKIRPGIVYIDYSVRKPIVYLADFMNSALDREGRVFPVHPFFSPKVLPEIYLGEQGLKIAGTLGYGTSLKGPYLDMAFAVLDELSDLGKDLFFVKKIDVSQAFAPSLGSRQIVVVVENEMYFASQESFVVSTHVIRLNPKHYRQELIDYMQLRSSILDAERQESVLLGFRKLKEKMIDLRLCNLAFVQ